MASNVPMWLQCNIGSSVEIDHAEEEEFKIPQCNDGKYHYKGMVDFGTNFHRLILLVVELAILLDLRAVVLLSDVISNAIEQQQQQ
ncbi:hypothetical protein T12_11443 [Trichinella patagoniensis]|uniref:Uncharacterized protein n=1 Tax=Trichinella patagoniensis TaxID=990121 RepID=A0A0V0ZM81_9BILA|nr:hypothetical protein T12_11443 [Trichinella patagoniensis]